MKAGKHVKSVIGQFQSAQAVYCALIAKKRKKNKKQEEVHFLLLKSVFSKFFK